MKSSGSFQFKLGDEDKAEAICVAELIYVVSLKHLAQHKNVLQPKMLHTKCAQFPSYFLIAEIEGEN